MTNVEMYQSYKRAANRQHGFYEYIKVEYANGRKAYLSMSTFIKNGFSSTSFPTATEAIDEEKKFMKIAT